MPTLKPKRGRKSKMGVSSSQKSVVEFFNVCQVDVRMNNVKYKLGANGGQSEEYVQLWLNDVQWLMKTEAELNKEYRLGLVRRLKSAWSNGVGCSILD